MVIFLKFAKIYINSSGMNITPATTNQTPPNLYAKLNLEDAARPIDINRKGAKINM